jgi:DNA-binding MarR family transcriptional regulator
MKIYQLSQTGAKIANNTNAPDTSNWRVIYALGKMEYGTVDQIALQTGLDEGEVSRALAVLKRKSINGQSIVIER